MSIDRDTGALCPAFVPNICAALRRRHAFVPNICAPLVTHGAVTFFSWRGFFQNRHNFLPNLNLLPLLRSHMVSPFGAAWSLLKQGDPGDYSDPPWPAMPPYDTEPPERGIPPFAQNPADPPPIGRTPTMMKCPYCNGSGVIDDTSGSLPTPEPTPEYRRSWPHPEAGRPN